MPRRRSRRRGRKRERGQPRDKKPRVDKLEPLLGLDEISERVEAVLKHSPADETEIVWLEVRQGEARRQSGRVDLRLTPERTVLVRVLDLGRVGSFRTGSSEPGELADAVRFAMAQARVREPLAGLPHLPADTSPQPQIDSLFDEELAAMGPNRWRAWLMDLPAEEQTLYSRRTHTRALVFNSRGIRRTTETTAIELRARTGRKPGAGRSHDARRRLQDLQTAELIEQARRLKASGSIGDLPADSLPFVLSPSAVAELVDLLNQTSFSAMSYYDGTSFLREHINVQVFDRRFNLKDDGTDPSGLPFPFDLEGTAKHSVDLIAKGAPRTPTLDQRQAAVLGLPPTAHAIGGNNARAENLFLLPGSETFEQLLESAEGGIWIGWLDHAECFDPQRVGFRARARGARRIRNGSLAEAVPDFIWEDSLLRAFSALLGIGNEPVRRLGDDGYLGGISAPALSISNATAREL